MRLGDPLPEVRVCMSSYMHANLKNSQQRRTYSTHHHQHHHHQQQQQQQQWVALKLLFAMRLHTILTLLSLRRAYCRESSAAALVAVTAQVLTLRQLHAPYARRSNVAYQTCVVLLFPLRLLLLLLRPLLLLLSECCQIFAHSPTARVWLLLLLLPQLHTVILEAVISCSHKTLHYALLLGALLAAAVAAAADDNNTAATGCNTASSGHLLT
jgi:hypothetical protein